jgi:hypothetical protein
MYMLNLIIETLAAMAGGVIAATAICWLFWTVFKLVRHPEWGPPIALATGLFLLYDRIGSSLFLQIATLFSALFAAGCWWEGAAWRGRRAGKPLQPHPGP